MFKRDRANKMKMENMKFLKNRKKSLIIVGITGVILLIIIVVVVTILFSKSKLNNSQYFNIQFNTNGGTYIDEIQVKGGNKIGMPDNPIKDGFRFIEWQVNEEKFDFNTPISSDMIITAVWEKEAEIKTFIVSFDTGNGTKIDDIEVIANKPIEKPMTPKLSGYNFDGWYYNYEKYDFNTPITQDITLKAKWVEIMSNFNSNSNVVTSSNKYKCQGSFRSDIPEKNVTIGYSNHVNWTWSTYGAYGGRSTDDCYVTYKTSNSSIATVSERGIITAKESGTVYISECVNDTETKKELVCFKGKLIIENNNLSNTNNNSSSNTNNNNSSNTNNNPPVSSNENQQKYYACVYEYSNFSPTSTNIDLKLNDTYDIEKRVNYGNGHSTNSCVRKVFSKNNNIIKVTSDSKINAISVGNTSVDFCIVDEPTNTKLECLTFNVNVVDNRITNITLNKSSINLTRGNIMTLVASLTPSNAEKNIIWSSSNPSVAEVDSSGKITAVGKGNAIITAASSDGNISASCSVSVSNPALMANANIGVSTIASNSGIKRGIKVSVTATGGNGVYTYYIRVYKNGTLIGNTTNISSNELFIDGHTNGGYTVEYEVRDSDGNVKTGSSSSTISGF